MLLGGIVKKYTADLILLTKLKKIIVCIKEKFVQNFEVPIFNDRVFTPNPRQLWWIFLFEILRFMMVFRRIGLYQLKIKQKNLGKLAWLWSKNSTSETCTYISCANFSYAPTIFLNLFSNIRSAVYFFTIPLKSIS